MTLEQYYREYRSKGCLARWAILSARTRVEWDKHEGEDVKLDIEPDDTWDMDNLKGDCFDPRWINHITPERLKQEEKAFEQRVYDEGVWGMVGRAKCKCCGEWHVADSVWGFVGDDWENSGYDIDIMRETLAEIEEAS